MFCDQFIPTWWTQAPGNTPLLTGWLGGPPSNALAGQTEETVLQQSIKALAAVFGLTEQNLQQQLVAGRVFNWGANHFSAGGYSYATPLTNAALELLNTPLQGTVYFAGEALYNGAHPGTVEAALQSGKDTAEKIARHL
jgi:monoamine oxidase